MVNPNDTQNFVPQQDVTTSIDEHSTTTPIRTYQEWGTQQAGIVDGVPNALPACLDATHIRARRTVAENSQLQTNRKTNIQNQIDILDGEVQALNIKIEAEENKLKHEEGKIKNLQEEINDWKLRPQEMLKGLGQDAYDKLTFWIGGIILLLLTVYLFVFYSSAAYSAFFREFTPDDTTNIIVNSIFDTQAVYKAYLESWTTLIFILFITGVFLGLGFLFNSFSKQKGFAKYFKIASIIIVTFIFDFIIAYEIVEKIHNIDVKGSFKPIDPMTINMALGKANFWLIIFAGFVVYIIWGLVYDAFAKEFQKFDAVKYAIKIREEKIAEYKKECKTIKDKKQEFETEETAKLSKIKTRKTELDGVIVFVSDVKEYISDFMVGWIAYMKNAGKPKADIERCITITENFIKDLANNAYYTADRIGTEGTGPNIKNK